MSFAEDASRILISCDPRNSQTIQESAVRYGITAHKIGQTRGTPGSDDNRLQVRIAGKLVIDASVAELRTSWEHALEGLLHAETPEHLVPEVLQKS